MYLLISVTDVLPKSLFIVNVTNLDGIGVGGSGHVFKGEYKGRPVAMKVVSNVSRDPSSRKAFYREALVWRSLSHRFILPFLGIYKDEFQLYLVSPYMENGTLSHWRKSREPTVAEIHRMLEVAEGFKYIHSEGVTHGDLHGGNILLDSNFHCQIFDFGLARPAGTTVGRSAHRFLPNFASPELFGMCTNCGRVDCNGCGDDTQKGNVTMKIDVYAFGSLYYATFFDTVPFQGRSTFQIMSLITSGQRAGRLQTPNMEDDTWALIQRCWRSEPSARPEMQEIVKMLAQRP
ncbi:kinase-like domain-containing protein [Amanita rubescens]|nr:kinase-like domain-containing protein [Amanita rubescens]